MHCGSELPLSTNGAHQASPGQRPGSSAQQDQSPERAGQSVPPLRQRCAALSGLCWLFAHVPGRRPRKTRTCPGLACVGPLALDSPPPLPKCMTPSKIGTPGSGVPPCSAPVKSTSRAMVSGTRLAPPRCATARSKKVGWFSRSGCMPSSDPYSHQNVQITFAEISAGVLHPKEPRQHRQAPGGEELHPARQCDSQDIAGPLLLEAAGRLGLLWMASLIRRLVPVSGARGCDWAARVA